jgi:hypothetical protein
MRQGKGASVHLPCGGERECCWGSEAGCLLGPVPATRTRAELRTKVDYLAVKALLREASSAQIKRGLILLVRCSAGSSATVEGGFQATHEG